MISFLLLTLAFVYSYFSSCFRCKVRLFIWDFSSFLWWACIVINYLLRTILLCLIDFGALCFCFLLSPGILKFSPDFFSDPLVV